LKGWWRNKTQYFESDVGHFVNFCFTLCIFSGCSARCRKEIYVLEYTHKPETGKCIKKKNIMSKYCFFPSVWVLGPIIIKMKIRFVLSCTGK